MKTKIRFILLQIFFPFCLLRFEFSISLPFILNILEGQQIFGFCLKIGPLSLTQTFF